MRKTVLALFAIMASVFPTQAQNQLLLPLGTEVPVVVDREINAYDLKEGQMIELTTAADVKAQTGEVLIPKGSPVAVRVRTGLKQRVLANQKRRLIIDIKEVRLTDGTKIPLYDGVVSFTARSNTGDLDATPLKFVNGHTLLIPMGHVMTAKVEVSQNIRK